MGMLRSITVIPIAAIQRGTIGAFVYVVNEDQTVSVRQLTLGPTEGEKIAVLEGLQSDERVVVDGADKLREGMKVKLITREPALTSDKASALPEKKIHQDKIEKNGN
jgi:multidrug efflux system membrane fusion protein